MKKRYIMCFILILLFFSPVSLFIDNVKGEWGDSDYNYKKKITIDLTKVAGDEVNFPVLISVTDNDLRDESNGGNVKSVNGYDIVFYNSDENTLLKHEIESYDKTIGKLVFWVNITSISSSINTDFYIYYGKSGVTVNPSSTDTWDSNFIAVYHMDSSDTTLIDSTENRDATKDANTEPENVNGKIGNAQDFERDDTEKVIASKVGAITSMTVECWYKPESVTGTVENLVENTYISGVNTGGFTFWRHSDGRLRWGAYRDGAQMFGIYSTNTLDNGNDYYCVGVLSDDNYGRVYIDGVQENEATPISGDMTDHADAKLRIGNACFTVGNYRYYADGIIDEVRISDIARSNNWISTTHETQNNPDGFMSWGDEESGNTPPTISNENPLHNSTGISLQPIVNATITDSDGDNCICNFYTSIDNISWIWRQTNTSILNESIEYNYIQASSYSTLYYWKITVNDTNYNISSIFNFTTKANNPPSFGVPSPTNNSIDQSLTFTWSIFIGDADIDTFNWTINCSNEQTNSGNVASNGTKTLSLTGLSYNTTYTVWVNATDTYNWTKKWFNFTTILIPTYPPVISNESPSNNSINISLFPVLSITISDLDGDSMSITWLSNASGTWENIGYVLSNVYNGTYYQKFTEFAIYDLTYYWNVSVTDGTETTVSNASSFTAESTPTDSNGNGDNDDIGLLGIFGFLGYLAYRRLRKRKE